jgi:hypothetical protein
MTLHYILYIYHVSHYILIGTLRDLYKFYGYGGGIVRDMVDFMFWV